jgi:hypothetical protein
LLLAPKRIVARIEDGVIGNEGRKCTVISVSHGFGEGRLGCQDLTLGFCGGG